MKVDIATPRCGPWTSSEAAVEPTARRTTAPDSSAAAQDVKLPVQEELLPTNSSTSWPSSPPPLPPPRQYHQQQYGLQDPRTMPQRLAHGALPLLQLPLWPPFLPHETGWHQLHSGIHTAQSQLLHNELQVCARQAQYALQMHAQAQFQAQVMCAARYQQVGLRMMQAQHTANGNAAAPDAERVAAVRHYYHPAQTRPSSSMSLLGHSPRFLPGIHIQI